MTMIKSNSHQAQMHATQLQMALSRFNTAQIVDKDTLTTLSGNSLAHTRIDDAFSLMTQISQAVGTACSNLQSVASEFEAIDQAQARQIGKNDG